MTRTATSPRFATRTRLNTARGYAKASIQGIACDADPERVPALPARASKGSPWRGGSVDDVDVRRLHERDAVVERDLVELRRAGEDVVRVQRVEGRRVVVVGADEVLRDVRLPRGARVPERAAADVLRRSATVHA